MFKNDEYQKCGRLVIVLLYPRGPLFEQPISRLRIPWLTEQHYLGRAGTFSLVFALLFFLVCKKTYDRPFVATKLKFAPHFDHIFMVGGQDALHVWKLDESTKKAANSIIPLGKIKRTISDLVVNISEPVIFCCVCVCNDLYSIHVPSLGA